MIDDETTEKVTICLPYSVYHGLRNQAYEQNISLPEFIRRRINLKPAQPLGGEILCGGNSATSSLSDLPLSEIFKRTTPKDLDPDERIDFFHG